MKRDIEKRDKENEDKEIEYNHKDTEISMK